MNKNLKVIQLIDSLNPGGAEIMAVNIANGLSEVAIESHICTTRLEGDLKIKIAPSVGYIFLNKKNVIDIKAIKKLHNYIKENKITIIHAHSSSYFTAFLIKLVQPKLAVIWHDHYGKSEHLKERKKFPLNFFSNKFKAIISVNNTLLDWSLKNLKPDAVFYIPNFASLNLDKKIQTSLKGIEGKRIVCLANLRPQKDHLNLLNAFKIIHDKYIDWTLHLVGMDLNDVYSQKIKTFIIAEKLQNHVFLYGACSDIHSILEQATIGVLSSNSEGLPVALLEYGLAKLPVAVTDVGECGVVVENGVSGIVVDALNENKLAEGILSLIKNKEDRLKYGKKLYSNVNSNYSKENYLKQLLEIYNK